MNIVGIRKDTGTVFESQSFDYDIDDLSRKDDIISAIQGDARSGGIEITISEMTDEELQSATQS